MPVEPSINGHQRTIMPRCPNLTKHPVNPHNCTYVSRLSGSGRMICSILHTIMKFLSPLQLEISHFWTVTSQGADAVMPSNSIHLEGPNQLSLPAEASICAKTNSAQTVSLDCP